MSKQKIERVEEILYDFYAELESPDIKKYAKKIIKAIQAEEKKKPKR